MNMLNDENLEKVSGGVSGSTEENKNFMSKGQKRFGKKKEARKQQFQEVALHAVEKIGWAEIHFAEIVKQKTSQRNIWQ